MLPKWQRAIQLINEKYRPSASVDLPVVVALGAASIIAKPHPISRRALFGLAWKDRKHP